MVALCRQRPGVDPERRSLMQFPICDVVWFVKFSRFGQKDFTNRGERKRNLTQIIVGFCLDSPVDSQYIHRLHELGW